MWCLDYPMTSSILSPSWFVNFKLKICVLKIKTGRSWSAVFILSLSIIKCHEIQLFKYFLKNYFF